MIKLLAGLFLWGAKTTIENKQAVQKRTREEQFEAFFHFQPEDPIPRGVVDIESWKYDIEHFRTDVVADWYWDGKYKKIIKEHPVSADDWLIDTNAYYADREKYKDGPKDRNSGEPLEVCQKYELRMYRHIHPQDENGNFVDKWPDQEEWEKIREEEYAKLRALRKKKNDECGVWLEKTYKK